MNSGESQILIETVPRLLYPFENSNLKSNDKLILVSIEYKLVVGNRRSDVMWQVEKVQKDGWRDNSWQFVTHDVMRKRRTRLRNKDQGVQVHVSLLIVLRSSCSIIDSRRSVDSFDCGCYVVQWNTSD